jgi:hypothetical protein
MIVSVLVIAGALVVLALRHRPGAAGGDRWGEPPPRDEDLYDADDEVELDDEADDANRDTGDDDDLELVDDDELDGDGTGHGDAAGLPPGGDRDGRPAAGT